MTRKTKALLLGVTISIAMVMAGCETNADIELKRAEKSLNEALAAGADASASDDYQKAEQLLTQAQELAKANKILESRQTAVEAKICADDALRKAQEQQKILDDEANHLGK